MGSPNTDIQSHDMNHPMVDATTSDDEPRWNGSVGAIPVDTLRRQDHCEALPLRQWLQQHGSKKLVLLLDTFLHELRLHAATNMGNAAPHHNGGTRYKMVHQTLNLIRHMIGSTSWHTPAEILTILRRIGSEIVHTAGTNQQDPVLVNMIRRVMAAIREEAIREDHDATTATTTSSCTSTTGSSGYNTMMSDGGRLSLQSILWALPPPQRVGRSGSTRQGSVGTSTTGSAVAQRQESLASEEEMKHAIQASATTTITTPFSYTFPASYYTIRPNFKVTVLEAVQEILTDLEDTQRNINEQVLNYIHAGEIILTCGNSETIESFLKAAHSKIQPQQQQSGTHNTPPFTVIVCGDGEPMANNLAKAGIATTVMEYSNVFAVMARVNKVLLPVHAVLANGGLVTPSGGHLVALVAHQTSVPVVCITGLYNICPMFPQEGQSTLQELQSPVPKLVANYNELYTHFDTVELLNPLRDYIEPKLITLYITNVGSFPPSFLYRLLAETYHIDDWKSF